MKIDLHNGKKAQYPVPLVSVEKAFKASNFMKGVGRWVKVEIVAPEPTVCEIQVVL